MAHRIEGLSYVEIAQRTGLSIILEPGSELDADIDGTRRRLALKDGEARFTVFHESRPFIVVARGMEVVARGTQFVVRVTPDATWVSLVEGRVEVSYPSTSGGTDRSVTRLFAGQRLEISAAGRFDD